MARRRAHHGVPPVRSRGRRRVVDAHRGARHIRRRAPLRVRPCVRSAARQHHRPAEPARRAHRVGPDQGDDRLLPRSADRLRVRRQPGWREARLLRHRRRLGGRLLGCRVGRRHGHRLARLDGGVPHPAQPAPLSAGAFTHLRRDDRSRHRTPERADELAAAPPVTQRPRLAVGRRRRVRGARLATPTRDHAVRARAERRRGARRRHPPLAAGNDGRGREVRAHLEPDARRDDQSRLRPGRGRSGAAQPHRVRDVLRGAPPLLPRGEVHLPVRCGSGAALLLTAHRARPAAHRARARGRRRPGRVAHSRCGEAHRSRRRGHVARGARRDDRPHHGRRHDDRAAHDLRTRARHARSARRRERHRRDGHRGRPRARCTRGAVPAAGGIRGRGRWAPPLRRRPVRGHRLGGRELGARLGGGDRANAALVGAPVPAPRRRAHRGHDAHFARRHVVQGRREEGRGGGAWYRLVSAHVVGPRDQRLRLPRARRRAGAQHESALHPHEAGRRVAQRVARVLRPAPLHDGGTSHGRAVRGLRQRQPEKRCVRERATRGWRTRARCSAIGARAAGLRSGSHRPSTRW